MSQLAALLLSINKAGDVKLEELSDSESEARSGKHPRLEDIENIDPSKYTGTIFWIRVLKFNERKLLTSGRRGCT